MLNYLKSERGASAAEYALILAVLGTATALSAAALKSAIGVNIQAAAAQTASLDATTVATTPGGGGDGGGTTTPGGGTTTPGGGTTTGGDCHGNGKKKC